MSNQGLIYFIGPRASGKTSVTRALGKELCLPWIDLDVYFSEKFKISIQEFIQEHDWPTFRIEESKILREVTVKYYPKTALIATGGGIILDQKNATYMQEHGQVIYLKVGIDILVERLQKDPKASQRPSLTHLTLAEEVGKILAEREPLYEALASVTLASDASLSSVVENVKKIMFSSN